LGKELVKHAADFTDIHTLFITLAPLDSAIAYTLRLGIGRIPYYYSLIDTSYQAPLLFGLRTTPTTLLYNEEHKLIKGFEGEVNAAKLIKTIREHENASK